MHAINPWIPVIVQVGLGLITIAGTGVVVHWLNTRKERKDFYRAKARSVVLSGRRVPTTMFHDDASVGSGDDWRDVL